MRIGETARPFERLFARLHLDDGIASNEFLGFGEGTVDDAALAAFIFDPEALCARMESIGVQQDAALASSS